VTKAPESLGEIELRYVPDAEPIVPAGGSWLPYLGGGEGQVLSGPLRGRVRFSTFEDDLSGQPCLVSGIGRCALHITAIVDTDDAAQVRIEALGYAVRAEGTRWHTTLGVRAASDDPRYAWIGDRSLSWVGDFDEEPGIGRAGLFLAEMTQRAS
jgi:hypothetical protein